MKTVIALVTLLVSTSAFAFAPGSSSVAGKWKVHSSIVGNDSDMQCTFSQTDQVLAGTCKGEQGDLKITGKIVGTKVTWSYDSDYNGTQLKVEYNGTFASGRITGNVSVEPFDVGGGFTATPAQ